MKWPYELILVRHDTSVYNTLRSKKRQDPLYEEFLREYEADPTSAHVCKLARTIKERFSLRMGDARTPLEDVEASQAVKTGIALAVRGTHVPDVIFVSPYERAKDTLRGLAKGWPALSGVKTYKDERIREQEHGLALIYNDWRVFNVFHPEQRELRDMEGSYWYRYPQGENVPDMQLRNRSWLTTLTREFACKRVFVVTHHLNILATRANLERWDDATFIHHDEREKPINCGVTFYEGDPDAGEDGHLNLATYNERLY